MARRPRFLLDRSVGEIMVLMIAITVCVGVVGAGIFIGIVEARDPSVDTDRIVTVLADTINTLIGLMAGFLAGRSDASMVQAEGRLPPLE